MFGSGRESLPDVRECSRDFPECPGVDGRPSRMSGSGRETHQDVREWLEALQDVQEWS